MARIFHVRINLDAVSADLNTLVDDAERGAWLRGFMSGASGGANRFEASSPCHLGWALGSASKAKAEHSKDKGESFRKKFTPYKKKLKDPRWQRVRLEVMQRDNWTCTICTSKTKTLNVHHKAYFGDPWDAPLDALQTLCEECHEKIELGDFA